LDLELQLELVFLLLKVVVEVGQMDFLQQAQVAWFQVVVVVVVVVGTLGEAEEAEEEWLEGHGLEWQC
jgi:hypothetical protein